MKVLLFLSAGSDEGDIPLPYVPGRLPPRRTVTKPGGGVS